MKNEKYIGCGIYTLCQAAKLLRLRCNVLSYWLGEREDSPSVITRQLEKDHLITFAELMELHFVKMFRDEDVSLQAIKKAAKAASRKFGATYPFTVRRFDTDGKSIFATLQSKETDREGVEELKHGQLVFQTIIRPFFKKLDYSGTEDVERYWPLEKSGRVVLDPTRQFGQPIDSETGVPTEAIIQALNAGGGQDAPQVAKWFEIPLEAVKAAARFERSLAT